MVCPENLFHAGWAGCAAAGKQRRGAQKAEAVESGNAELASSDSEEEGIALGNAPGARGSSLTIELRSEVHWPDQYRKRTGFAWVVAMLSVPCISLTTCKPSFRDLDTMGEQPS